MKHVETVVVGLGSIGSMALWQLAQAGAAPGAGSGTGAESDPGAGSGASAGSGSCAESGPGSVLGIEQFGAVHAAGAYPGESRLFRVAAKEGELYTPALMRSRELWQELEAQTGRELLVTAGALSVAPAGFVDLEQTLASIEHFDLPHRILDPDELRRDYPQFHITDQDMGVLDTLGGALRPEAAVLSAVTRAQELGAQAWFHTEVLEIEESGDSLLVHTTRESVRAERVIVTAGPWSSRIAPVLRRLLKVASFALTWFAPAHPELFGPDRLPGFMRDLDGFHAFGVPTLDGVSIKLCPHIELPEVSDYAERARVLEPEQLAWATEIAHRMIPDLVGDPLRASVHPDAITESHIPIIDTAADGRIVFGTGFSGNGFKFAPVWGQVLAQLALHGESPLADPAFTIGAHLAGQKPATVAAVKAAD